jgi:hypothetical protein
MADTVGLVPNVRAKDNLLQAVGVGLCVIIGVGVGYLWAANPDAGRDASFGMLVGGVAGLVLGFFLTGLVLMVVGLIRRGR